MLSSENTRASMIPAPVVQIGARALIRLEAAMEMMKHYETANHKPTADQLRCDPVIKNFKLEFDALKDRKKKDVSAPLASKKLDVVRWTEIFLDSLCRIVGARNMPLTYTVRTADVVDFSMPFVLMEDVCYKEDARSLEEESSRLSSHDNALLKEDNAEVCIFLEEATRSTTYSASIKHFQKKKDDQNAWFPR